MKKTLLTISAIVVISLALISCGGGKGKDEKKYDSLAINYTVLNTLPHNTEAFIQGLVVYNHKILESTGQHNTSWIAEVNPATGEHDKKVVLDPQYFGEGITVMNNKIYQLTWQTRVGFIYDAHTYKKLGEFQYSMEGWGITHDDKNLIMSDGTEKIHFLDTATMKVVHTITVTDGGTRVKELNELEYINGYIFANVWNTNWILKINPATGKVVGRMDLSRIGAEIKTMYPEADVLNGIAYDPNSKALLVTGKLWPKAYLIRLQ